VKFLGVDAGGSGTRALVANESGLVIGEGAGGPWRESLSESIGRAVQQACSEPLKFDAACLGFSGGPPAAGLIANFFESRLIHLVTDAQVALSGAFGGGPGVVAIAGTGSIAWGKNACGKMARAGGWGYVFGDEGGAFDVVRQAVRAALRFEEGWGDSTALRIALLEATQAQDMNDLLHRFYEPVYSRDRIAVLAKVVSVTAAEGDRIAREILHSAANALAMLAASVRGQLFGENEEVKVSYAGRVFEEHPIRERFSLLAGMDANVIVTHPLYTPAEGALIEAFCMAGLTVMPHRGPVI